MKRVLISTLGTSPPVVTEALDILKKEGKKVDKVVILTTSDPDTQNASDLLQEHIILKRWITFLLPVAITTADRLSSELYKGRYNELQFQR